MKASNATFHVLACVLYTLVWAEQIQLSNNAAAEPLNPNEAARFLGGSLYSTRFEDVRWDNEQWTITATIPRPQDYHSVAFTANGYFGASMASTGPFVQYYSETNGWPLFNRRQTFSTVSGFFDRQPMSKGTNFPWLSEEGWDSFISGIPHWTPLIIALDNGRYLAANTSMTELSNVLLTQDLRRGLAKWQYTWSPTNSNDLSFDITYTAFADRLHVNRGYVRLEIQSSQDCDISLFNVLDGSTALRTDFVESGFDGKLIYTSVSPTGVSNVTAWVYATLRGEPNLRSPTVLKTPDYPFIGKSASSIAQIFPLSLRRLTRTAVVKYVGIASSDGFLDPQIQAKAAVLSSVSVGFGSILKSHAAEWEIAMPRNSTSDYSAPDTALLPDDPALIEKAIVSVVSVFCLLMNTISENALAMVESPALNINGISVSGLTSDGYGGQKFWDQDFWMHPYLSASFPATAKQITNSRVAQYSQAKANIQTKYTSSKNLTYFSDNAAIYPWTSGRDGNCTATGPCWDYEYHINGDIAHSFISQWCGSGETDYLQAELFPIMNSISSLFRDILVKKASLFELHNMTDPDEYANNVNNGGFTMSLIANTLNNTDIVGEHCGRKANSEWQDIILNLYMPRSGKLTLEYDAMNGSIEVKQADVVLKIYPLAICHDYTIAQKSADLNYYAGKQSHKGPGMTYAIFSASANSISESGCAAYTYDKYSWSPYARAPWFLFSEQLVDDPSINGGTHPAYPFLTGHGGFLQVDTYGYLGLRRKPDWILRVDPALPPQIKHLTFPIFYHHGWPVRAKSNQTHTVLKRGLHPLKTANATFRDGAVSVLVSKDSASDMIGETYEIMPGGALVLENRMYHNNKTELGNILQCRKVSSASENEPGLFPDAAVDGAVSTSWQPTLSSKPQSLTVDLTNSPFHELTYASFNWAQQPPVNATIVLHNDTNWDAGYRINIYNITINKPYNKSAANDIRDYEGNTTMIRFKQVVWSSSFVSLIVSGNQGNSSSGAPGSTVAEFALVAK